MPLMCITYHCITDPAESFEVLRSYDSSQIYFPFEAKWMAVNSHLFCTYTIHAVDCIALFLAQQGRSWLTRRWSSYWLARRTLRAISTMRSLSGLSSAPKFLLCQSCHCIWVGIRPVLFYLPVLASIYVCLRLPNVCILFQIHLYIFVKSWLYVHSYTNLYFVFLQLTSMLLFLARKK